MSIESLWPTIEWPRIWKNLWTAPVTDSTKTTWYKIIHDIVPTKERLHKIRIAPTQNCRLCDRKDTLLHRLAECRDGRYQWEWTKKRLAIMLIHDGYRKNGYSDHTSHSDHHSANVLYCGCWRNWWGLDRSLSGT